MSHKSSLLLSLDCATQGTQRLIANNVLLAQRPALDRYLTVVEGLLGACGDDTNYVKHTVL